MGRSIDEMTKSSLKKGPKKPNFKYEIKSKSSNFWPPACSFIQLAKYSYQLTGRLFGIEDKNCKTTMRDD